LASKKPFLSFVIEEDFLKEIDDYRFNNRFPSRAEAIKYLIRLGLNHHKVENKKHDAAQHGEE